MKILDLRTMELPDERVTSWLKSNGLNPDLVPADQAIDVTGALLVLDSFVREASGHRVYTMGSGRGLRVRIEIPHKSRPEAHGFEPESGPSKSEGKHGSIVIDGTTEVPLASDGSFSVILPVNGPSTLS